MKAIGYLYINGLGSGKTNLRVKFVQWWWKRAGLEIRHAQINWYDGKDLNTKLQIVEKQATDMFQTFDRVVMIGASAGGSLALNTFDRLKNRDVLAVSAHGRLHVGEYAKEHSMSLYRRAKLNTNHSSQSFFDSVTLCEKQTLKRLTTQDKQRILTLTQLTDRIVAPSLMQIPGVHNYRSVAFGHWGGFLAHLFGDRDMIEQFAQGSLNSPSQ